MKRWIIWLHRYLGIPMSVVFVIWFMSGIFMIYAGDMPSLSVSERLSQEPPIDFESLSLSPQEAVASAGIDGEITELTLEPLLGRPAYRIGRIFGPRVTLFADTGEIFTGADADQAAPAVAALLSVPPGSVEFIETVTEVDQWTMALSRQLPLERFDVDDGRGTRAYFSLQTGRLELLTTRQDRTLAWIGTIPHWFYFTPLRTNQPLWYWTVVWVSVAGCVLATLGIVLAFTQFRRSRPFRLSVSVRYRGWMRWHYYTGAVFGVFALTWVFSGLLSMEPFAWTNAEGMYLPRNDLEGGSLELERYRLEPSAIIDVAGGTARRVELRRIQTEPYFVVSALGRDGAIERKLVHAATLAPRVDHFPADSILSELEATVTEAAIVEHAVLDSYDAYYYARDAGLPLPVLRVKFDDPAETWAYFDLNTSSHMRSNHRLSRLERWLFNGLHSLDFSFWYGRRPLWDIVLIVLSLGALASSAIGMFLGFRRLTRRADKKPRRLVPDGGSGKGIQ